MKFSYFFDIIVLVAITIFLLTFFKPELLLTKTITSGGDTASHYYPAHYLKNYLLPHSKISGWAQGAYAGSPLFVFYFPLPFLVMVSLSYLIPLQIAFKIGTILGIFLLPIFAYLAFRLFGFKFPLPSIAAIFTLFFLFNEGNSMWGGNIPSTLAGEFAYSLGLALTILYFGVIYRGIKENKYLFINTILLFLIGLSHVYALLWVGFSSLFFLKHWKYLFKLFLGAFLLLGFFIVPMLANLQHTTAYADKWNVAINDIFPQIFYPAILFAIFLLYFVIKEKTYKNENPVFFLSFTIIIAFIFYLIAYYLGLVNIRFIPFIQLALVLLGAYGLNCLIDKIRIRYNKKYLGCALLVLILILSFVFIQSKTTYISGWIKWNYEGFENKVYWPQFSGINSLLEGAVNDPRVVYEHNMENDKAGTPRAFESLPLFSGRNTLEGVYMQSSLTAPYVFYVQSEISQQASCPFPNRRCASFNLTAGTEHLKLFNVKDFIAITEKTKNELKNNREYKLIGTFPPYAIYELKTNKNQYVEVLEYEPIKVSFKDYYEWFKSPENLKQILVYNKESKINSLEKAKQVFFAEPIGTKRCEITELIREEEILFNTTCLNKPHLIKVSYFPNWKVEGADKIYLASPSFMLVYPQQENIRLVYSKTVFDYIGVVLTMVGVGLMFVMKKKS